MLAVVQGASLEDLETAAPAGRRGPSGPSGADLQSLIRDALEASEQQRTSEAELAYRVALVAQAARASRGTFDSCARALGMSRQTLQPYALVAERWSGKELRHLLAERRNARGEPISISHLALLAKLPRSTCDALVERVFAEGLTVHELRRVLRKRKGK